MTSSGRLNLVSVGPGFVDLIPSAAEMALRESSVVVGYELYFTWIQPWIEGKEIYSFPISKERERVQKAIECARAGQVVSLVSSGDVGVYGMAPLALEAMKEDEPFQLQIIPGISAANSAAAILGSPLSHDFATLSLSDLLCPWDWIEQRTRHVAKVDLVVALYNVQSQSRPDGVYRILNILLEDKGPRTWCGVVRNAYRPGQTHYVCSLAALLERQFDMLTTIIVGNRFTQRKGPYIYTPRGYHGWSQSSESVAENERERRPEAAGSKKAGNDRSVTSLRLAEDEPAVWVFSGTGDGNALAAELGKKGYRLIISTASEYGAEVAGAALPGLQVRSGRKGIQARRNELRESRAVAVIDATHPFATGISTQLTQLASELEIPYIRYERPRVPVDEFANRVRDMQAAARKAIELGRRIFLATGIKDLERFLEQPFAGSRDWFVRITPDADSLEQALRQGIPRSHICAVQGPFSTEINIALWSTWKVDCVVTKESGEAGGFQSKVEAARALGVPLIVVERPEMDYPVVANDFEAVAHLLEQSLKALKSAS